MAALAPAPKFYEHDQNGAPLAGGFVYTYISGSTTPLATYTDAGGMSSNTNPVELDSAGRADIWLLPTSLYKFVVTTSTGVPVYTVNSIGASASVLQFSQSSGSSLVGFIQAGSGAVATTAQAKMRERVSILDYMSDAMRSDYIARTASIDIAAAIQSAIEYIKARGGGVVELPPGKGLIASPLQTYSDVALEGAGSEATTLVKTANSTIAGGSPATTVLTCLDNESMGDVSGNVNCFIWVYNALRGERVRIQGITLTTNSSTPISAPVKFGIAGVGVSESDFIDVTIVGCRKAAIVMPTMFVGSIRKCKGMWCDRHIAINNGTTLSIYDNYALYCRSFNYYLYDIKYFKCWNNAADGLNNESNTPSYSDRSAYSAGTVIKACFSGSWTENGQEQCYGTSFLIDSCQALDVKNNVCIEPASDYTGATRVALIWINQLAHNVDVSNNKWVRNGVTALQGAADPAIHHDIAVTVSSENQGFRCVNNWTCDTLYDAPSTIYGNNTPTYLSLLTQAGQMFGFFTPVMTLPGATGVTVTPGANNFGRWSIVNGYMYIEIGLDIASATFTGTGTPTISGIPIANNSVQPARLLVDQVTGVTFAAPATESYWLAVSNAATSGTFKNRDNSATLSTSTAFVSGATNMYMHIQGSVWVGPVANIT